MFFSRFQNPSIKLCRFRHIIQFIFFLFQNFTPRDLFGWGLIILLALTMRGGEKGHMISFQ